MNKAITLTVPEENHLERIDIFLASSTDTGMSRSIIQRLIKDKNILVNKNEIRPNYKVKTDDEISITIPEPETTELIPVNIPLNIIYEDEHIAVLKKQAGLVVHSGPGNYENTLVNALLYHIKTLPLTGDPMRPGIVHRLDRDTSGLMVIAKTDLAYNHLVEEFSQRKVYKKYCAIITGKTDQENDTISKPIGRHKKYRHKMTVTEDGKEAITDYSVQKIWHINHSVFSLLDIQIHTGRTHQIRVHLSSMGNPVIGDRIYSKKWEKHKVPFHLLAATELSFVHPFTGETMKFKAELPQHMLNFISRLDSLNPDN
ncbi:MAG: RluA family pseudouridine synthase [Spirochaetota bacterium]